MTKATSLDKMERLKHKHSLARRSFRYNRFLSLRYALALFCFTNLYWVSLIQGLGVAWIVPALMVLIGFPAVFEQVKLLTITTLDITNDLKFTQMFFMIQLIANVAFIAIVLSGIGFSEFYPFLTSYMNTRIFMAGIIFIGVLLALFFLRRISKIKTNTDTYYFDIIEMEKAVTHMKKH